MSNLPCEQCGRLDFVSLKDDGLLCEGCRELDHIDINIEHELAGGLTEPSY